MAAQTSTANSGGSAQGSGTARDGEFYKSHRAGKLETDLREPYRIPSEVMVGTKELSSPGLPEAPLVVFINARSGGRAGPDLAVALYRGLGHAQVFDLGTKEGRPDKVLRKIWANFEAQRERNSRVDVVRQRMRVLAAGGDGTVAWILKTVKTLELQPEPAVAIMPLGTGNDLSRSLAWGPSFESSWVRNHDKIYATLKRIADADVVDMDGWKCVLTAPRRELFDTKLPPSLSALSDDAEAAVQGFSWNYVSIGMDAKAAYGFHSLREEKPHLAFSRMANQFWYSYYACMGGWFCCPAPVAQRVRLQALNKRGLWEEVPLPAGVKAVVILNLQSYAGGRNLWGTGVTAAEAKRGWKQPSYDDNLVEVVGLPIGWGVAPIMAGLAHATRLAQAPGIRAEMRAEESASGASREVIHMQLDGEPWAQPLPAPNEAPLVLEITHGGKSKVLFNTVSRPPPSGGPSSPPVFPSTPAPAAAAAPAAPAAAEEAAAVELQPVELSSAGPAAHAVEVEAADIEAEPEPVEPEVEAGGETEATPPASEELPESGAAAQDEAAEGHAADDDAPAADDAYAAQAVAAEADPGKGAAEEAQKAEAIAAPDTGKADAPAGSTK